MGARLNTLTDEVCQITTHVSRIAHRQARLYGFVASPSPSSQALANEDNDDGDDKDEDEDEDASSSIDDEITTSR